MASERALRASRDATLFHNLDLAAKQLGVPNSVMDRVYEALTIASPGKNPQPNSTALILLRDGLIPVFAKRVRLHCAGYEAWHPLISMSKAEWQQLLNGLGLEHEPIVDEKRHWVRLTYRDYHFEEMKVAILDQGFVVRDPKTLTDPWLTVQALNDRITALQTSKTFWNQDVLRMLYRDGYEPATLAEIAQPVLEDPRLHDRGMYLRGCKEDARGTWAIWDCTRDSDAYQVGNIHFGPDPDDPSAAVPEGSFMLVKKLNS